METRISFLDERSSTIGQSIKQSTLFMFTKYWGGI